MGQFDKLEDESMTESKAFAISKLLVWQAYLQIKKNGGAAGVDGKSLKSFDENRNENLYKIWNRLSSGSYFPPPVKGVSIPKKSGGERVLGIPTVSDRIAQMAIKKVLEPILEPIFDKDSYGYRPGKSAHDAIRVTRERCWKKAWVLEFDIKGLFDNIPHDLLLKSLKHHTNSKYIILYVERWLTAPMSKDGEIIERTKGTPQGGVISPLLANLYLHYCFDHWMRRKYPGIEFCRYADDGLLHCNSYEEANTLLQKLSTRFKECGLEMHPTKTKIVYCKTGKRKENYENISFDFLGFTFKPRQARDKLGEKFMTFSPGVSRNALTLMRQEVRRWKIHLKSSTNLESLSKLFNPKIRGWYNYYSKFYSSGLYPLWISINKHLTKWIRRKYKKVASRQQKAVYLLGKIANEKKNLFAHWQYGLRPTAG